MSQFYYRVWFARKVIVHTQQCMGASLGNRQVKSQLLNGYLKCEVPLNGSHIFTYMFIFTPLAPYLLCILYITITTKQTRLSVKIYY